jgi:hypothetical protein
VFGLSSSFGCLVALVTTLLPQFVPFDFFLDPQRNQWLLDLEIWVDWSKVLRCFTLVLPVLVVPVKNLNAMG